MKTDGNDRVEVKFISEMNDFGTRSSLAQWFAVDFEFSTLIKQEIDRLKIALYKPRDQKGIERVQGFISDFEVSQLIIKEVGSNLSESGNTVLRFNIDEISSTSEDATTFKLCLFGEIETESRDNGSKNCLKDLEKALQYNKSLKKKFDELIERYSIDL